MKILRILTVFVMAVLVGAVMACAIGVSPLWTIGGLLLFSAVIPRPAGALMFSVTLFDLARPAGNNVGAGGGLDNEIILINAADVDLTQFPARGEDGVTITGNIVMKANKYMHRFYMTQGTIEPSMKKVKGENKDCGGYEISLSGFYPGMEAAILKWIEAFGFAFEGYVIIQNCSQNKKYLIGEPCNLVSVEDIETKWGAEVDKAKGSNFKFLTKQSHVMANYEGNISYDPSSASW